MIAYFKFVTLIKSQLPVRMGVLYRYRVPVHLAFIYLSSLTLYFELFFYLWSTPLLSKITDESVSSLFVSFFILLPSCIHSSDKDLNASGFVLSHNVPLNSIIATVIVSRERSVETCIISAQIVSFTVVDRCVYVNEESEKLFLVGGESCWKDLVGWFPEGQKLFTNEPFLGIFFVCFWDNALMRWQFI